MCTEINFLYAITNFARFIFLAHHSGNGAKPRPSANHQSNLKPSKSSSALSEMSTGGGVSIVEEEPISMRGITKTSAADFNQWLQAMQMVATVSHRMQMGGLFY